MTGRRMPTQGRISGQTLPGGLSLHSVSCYSQAIFRGAWWF
jgi:hypothetical protein